MENFIAVVLYNPSIIKIMKLTKIEKQFLKDGFIRGLKALTFILSISIIGILIYLNL